MKNNILRIVFILSVIMLNIGCDQVTKQWAKQYFTQPDSKQVINVLGDFFILRYAENNGAFLSIFSGLPATPRFILLSILPSIIMLLTLGYLFYNNRLSKGYIFALATLLGGGLSNLLDRFSNNEFVIDFMNMGIGSIRTGIFNIADLSIMLGAGLLLFLHYQENRNQKSTSTLQPEE